MAPSVALEALASMPAKGAVLDPMCGSGTVLIESARLGHVAQGFDIDPLAVLISSVAVSRLRGSTLRKAGMQLADQVEGTPGEDARLPWSDPETQEFIEYWFAAEQRRHLTALAVLLHRRKGPTADAMRLALSRLIVTKDSGASLARDVSHSRPHKVAISNTFDVVRGFRLAISRIADWLDAARAFPGTAHVSHGDARDIPSPFHGSFDLVLTSPPYLNAIDYIRGHRLALVWMGYTVSDLRSIRSASIGAERRIALDRVTTLVNALVERAIGDDALPARQRGMLQRYAGDMILTAQQAAAGLKPSGRAIMVVGDSCLRGTYVRNSEIVIGAMQDAGFRMTSKSVRQLPASARYLPPPTRSAQSTLDKRMRNEIVLQFSAT
jgi:DNA modification methylase